MKRYLVTLIVLFSLSSTFGQANLQLALLKYNGGGDWYANPTSLPNLIGFCNQQLNMNLDPEPATVEVGSPELFNYPFIHMTGHGNVVLSEQERANLSTYLSAGGFLHFDDNYCMDQYVRPILNGLVDGSSLIEIPFTHEIYSTFYSFKNGLPKIHEHDDNPPKAYGLFKDGRLVLLYTFECDLGDGWEDPNVHGDPESIRQLALQMGANMIKYVFTY
jgi:hypothetical protein